MKLVVLYTQPEDAAAFDAHYLSVHGPLVEKIPGLARWGSAQLVAAGDGDELTYHREAELYFADQATLEAALGSDEGKATVADFGQIAPPGSWIVVAAIDE